MQGGNARRDARRDARRECKEGCKEGCIEKGEATSERTRYFLAVAMSNL